MDIRSLQEVNSEFLSKRKNKSTLRKTAIEVLFWVLAVLIIIAVLSFNYNSFLTKPVFGYSLYLTEGEKNLMLIKNADDFDPNLTAETIYQNGTNRVVSGVCSNSHKTVEVGIVKATFPTLGKILAFILDYAHIIFIVAMLWIAAYVVVEAKKRASYHGVAKGVRK